MGGDNISTVYKVLFHSLNLITFQKFVLEPIFFLCKKCEWKKKHENILQNIITTQNSLGVDHNNE